MPARLSSELIDQLPLLQRRILVHSIKRSLLASPLQMSDDIEKILNKPEYYGDPLSPHYFSDDERVIVLVARMMTLHTRHATTQSLADRKKCISEMAITKEEVEKLVGTKGKDLIVNSLAEAIDERNPIYSFLQHYTELYAAMKLHVVGEDDANQVLNELATMKKRFETRFSRTDAQALLNIIHAHVDTEIYSALEQNPSSAWRKDKPPSSGQRLH